MLPILCSGVVPSLEDSDAKVRKICLKRDRREAREAVEKLGELQKVFYADGTRAMLIILQGRDAAGKDGVVRTVIGAVNPSGVRINSFKAPSHLELAHDYLWRVHNVVPEKGMMGIFNRSHYEDVLVVRVRSLVKEAYGRSVTTDQRFRADLTENGTIILSFFLHVSSDAEGRLRERVEDKRRLEVQRRDLRAKALDE